MSASRKRLTRQQLEAEAGVALPVKEVISLLDLNVNVDLALDLAAPIDLAVAANLNVAAPIDAAVGANVLSFDSAAQAMAKQQVAIDQFLSGEAIADAPQTAAIDQSGVVDDGATAPAPDGTGSDSGTGADGGTNVTVPVTDTVTQGTVDTANLFRDGLLNVNVDIDLDANLAAPIAGAVAANANVVAPIDAAVAANVLSFNSEAIAVADQTAIINQRLEDVTAHATAAQDATITQ
jgi:hypothetical protein